VTTVARSNQTLPTQPFEWRDARGAFHKVREMETRHLFFTVCMIWNHAMPDDAKTHDYRRYTFGPFYTSEYMADAVRHTLRELLGRPDIEPRWRTKIDFMRDYLSRVDAEFSEILLLEKSHVAHSRLSHRY